MNNNSSDKDIWWDKYEQLIKNCNTHFIFRLNYTYDSYLSFTYEEINKSNVLLNLNLLVKDLGKNWKFSIKENYQEKKLKAKNIREKNLYSMFSYLQKEILELMNLLSPM